MSQMIYSCERGHEVVGHHWGGLCTTCKNEGYACLAYDENGGPANDKAHAHKIADRANLSWEYPGTTLCAECDARCYNDYLCEVCRAVL